MCLRPPTQTSGHKEEEGEGEEEEYRGYREYREYREEDEVMMDKQKAKELESRSPRTTAMAEMRNWRMKRTDGNGKGGQRMQRMMMSRRRRTCRRRTGKEKEDDEPGSK